jgi:hypothetical protein
MEAIMIGGLAVLAAGGYFSVIDFMNDQGIRERKGKTKTKRLAVSQRYVVTSQSGIEKMAGMHI